MKKILAVVFHMLAFSYAVSYGQNVTLLGSLNQYPGTAYTDVWGYEASGREYAFIGITGGSSIIDVTDPVNPEEIVFIQAPTAPPYEWRDFKTHSHYLYIISEGSGTGSGLQIIDLSQLPDTAFLVNTFNQTFTSAHNLYIEDGFAYVVGTSQGGMHILDLSNPTNPVQVGYYGARGYVHDVYVWNDTAYGSSANTYDLVNLTDKSNPQLISQSVALPGIYAHSGWLTEDKRYFIACEEFNVRDITVWDLVMFFNSLVKEDRSMLDLYKADFTFVNERLAQHYGFPGVAGNHFRRVQYPDASRRGLLGQGAILVQTSLANRTSPVLRGKWVMEVLIGAPPPAPPPNVRRWTTPPARRTAGC